jgi:signal transduction histidine kinase/tetratricopeptide (TPR) repeat protein
MLENLKLAVKRQKRLIIIFLLTIFIPSITLSIFGIRAIRNERFRLARQIENEHRGAAETLKSQIVFHFEELGSALQNLARSNAFLQRNDAGIQSLLEIQLSANPLVEQVFVAYEGEDPFFPLFQPRKGGRAPSPGMQLEGPFQERLKRAEAYEFKERNYKSAISVYRSFFDRSKDTNVKARMLANVARCLMKTEDYRGAIQNYQKIGEDYPESFSSSGLPMAIISQLQMATCYRNVGEYRTSLETYLNLYRDILHMHWPLGQAQFKTYAALVKDSLVDSLSENEAGRLLEDHKEEFGKLNGLYQERLEQWMVIEDIRMEIVPELRGRQDLAQSPSDPFRFHKILDGRNFLLSAVRIPNSSQTHSIGWLGIKIDEKHLTEKVIPAAIANIQFSDSPDVVISNLSGDILLGDRTSSPEPPTATAYFEDNFPPWRIEIFSSGEGASGALDIKRNFYFWTILTLVVVLISGAVLISRTIAQEMAVLKLKSDFVSSVSHEFKSPLTSIKSLAERLRDGKVKDSDRMKQYFSVITQDADRLTRLVTNILDFSKIEEGKREFEFVESDLGRLVAQTIEDFNKEEFAKEVKILTRIAGDIPPLELDKEALAQALNNLLENAVKFSPEKKEIEVILREDEINAIIEIKDRGIGVHPDESNKIFEKFYQGRNAVRQSSKGTGLGLTLVKHTVEAHGGRIEANSRAGGGSTFSIFIPIPKKRE